MNISKTSNRVPVQSVRTRTANTVSQNSFGDVLKQSSAKDTFRASSFPITADMGSSLGVADTQAKLDKISAAIKDTDYSDMTKAEIYAEIEKRYEDAFDDFHASRAILACTDHIMVNEQFYRDIDNYVGKIRPSNIVNEARGYTDMSYDEIEAAIREKYAGKTAFIDQLNLFGEMFSSGVLHNKYGSNKAVNMAMDLCLCVECGGNKTISKSEWLSRIEQTGTSSPFSLLLNSPYFSLAEKELFKSMVDDILFGVADKAE